MKNKHNAYVKPTRYMHVAEDVMIIIILFYWKNIFISALE